MAITARKWFLFRSHQNFIQRLSWHLRILRATVAATSVSTHIYSPKNQNGTIQAKRRKNCEAIVLDCSPVPCLRFPRWFLFTLVTMVAMAVSSGRQMSAQSATTTALTITSGGSAATSVQAGTVVTLTATVVSGTTPVTPGQVEFCDTSVSYCTDIFLVALSQLTKTGTAVYKFRPGSGNHSYKAVFLGTKTYSGSSSSASLLDVSGPTPSVTGISASSIGQDWTLTAQVSGGSSAGSTSPTGTVSFLDTSNADAVLATAPLSAGTQGLNFVSNYTLPANNGTLDYFNYNSAVADFNLDGIPDIAEAVVDEEDFNFPSNTDLVTLQGKGDGTFNQVALTGISDALNSAVNGIGNGLVAGDFNSDGSPDVVVADAALGALETLLGNGEGSFPGFKGSPVLCPDSLSGCGQQYIAVADFNGDGIPDVVVGGGGAYGSYTPDVYVEVVLGNGDGSFGNPMSIQFTSNIFNWFGLPPFPAVGDFNGDGIPDVVVADPNVRQVSMYPGKGDGTFGTPVIVTSGSAMNTIAVADFNRDGILDLAVTNTSNGSISIFLGKGDGTFTAGQVVPTGAAPDATTVGDFNGDGIPDIAVFNGTSTVAILLGKGDGTFTVSATESPVNNFLGGGWPGLAAGDFNGDGLTDLVASSSVYLAQSGWTATAQANNVTVTEAGTHLVQASYPGDSDFSPSASGTVSISPLQIAAITSPASGSQLSSSSVTFAWSAGIGVNAYKLSVGTTAPGSSNIYASPALTTTSAAVSGLPSSGITIYVTLSSEIGGVWQSQYYTYSTAQPSAAPVLTSPALGSQLSGSSATFTWTPGTGVADYSLCVGIDWPGGCNIYASPISTATTATATGLPTDGVALYVSIHYRVNGVWNLVEYTYTAAGQTAPPVLTSPGPGSVLSGSNVTFEWTPGSGVTAYSLSAGTYGPGYFNLGGSPQLSSSTTSYTVTNIPTDGKPVYITLRYQINGIWQTTDYTYTTAPLANPPVITSPTPGSVLPGSSVTFQWKPSSAVTAYSISAGTYGPGYFNLGGSPQLPASATSYTLTNIPTNGKPVYITLRYLVDGMVWQTTDYAYTASQ
jgi:hypothetical protein